MADQGEIKIEVDATRVNLKLEELPDTVRAALVEVIFAEGTTLADLARERAESLLTTRGGGFVKAIKFRFKDGKNRLTGRVVNYAKTANLFEWGGKTGAHQILPDKAKALMLPGGKFATRVQHPGGHYQRLEIIYGAFKAIKPDLVAKMQAAVDAAAARASD